MHFTQPTAQPQHQQAVPSTSADAVQPTSAAITAGNALAPITPADRVAIPATEAREVRDELARLQGVWNVRVFREHTEDEVTIEAGPVDLQQLEFRQHQLLTLQGGKVVSQATLTLDPTQHPKRMQIQRAAHDSGPRHAVYALDGNTLILCFVEQSADDQELDLSSESKAYRRRLILTRSASSSDTHATITAPLNTVTIVGSPLLLAPGTRCGVTLATSPEEGTPSATTTTAYYGTIAKVTNEKLLLIVTALDRRVTHSQPHPLTSLPWVGTYFQSFQKRYQKNTGVGRESIEPTEFCFDLSSIQSIQVLWDNTIPTNLPKPQPTVAEPK